MPTVMTHALIPAALAVAAGRNRIAPRVALAGMLLAMLPDADVIGFRFGIAYADDWGHRGALHSLAMAAVMTGAVLAVRRDMRGWGSAAFLLFAAASHGLLDMLTSGGLGVALFWPVESARHFAPWRPIRVSPIGMRFLSPRGWETALSELRWVWLPCGILMLGSLALRRSLRMKA
ncbi:MAG: metal-dependent hydrolase [Novosphingobium sp.]|nr:metal-dependent hydrolase [Novosphingobium sp.]